MLRVLSLILSNSSMQQTPLSANTSAPVCKTKPFDSEFRVTEALSPTEDEPLPEVNCERGTRL